MAVERSRAPEPSRDHPRPAELLALYAAGRLDDAERGSLVLLAESPRDADALHVLGLVALSRGDLARAEELLRDATKRRPGETSFHNNLAAVLRQRGRPDEAIASYERALACAPSDAVALNGIGALLLDRGALEEAAEHLERAVAANPRLASAQSNLGIVRARQGRWGDALEAHRQAVALAPVFAEGHNNYGSALQRVGRVPEALDHFRTALALRPGYREAHANHLLALNYLDKFEPAEVFAAHRAWAQRFADPVSARHTPPGHDRDPERVLRIGYVSPDFRQHPVAMSIAPLIEAHDRSAVHVTCYSQVTEPDATTERFRAGADAWRDISGLDDEAAADLVRRDSIDILIDLAGHTVGNRLGVLARRPAPLQGTFQGYPNTTGMSAVDFRLTDAHCDPPGVTDAWHSEQLVRLPHSFLCFEPPEAPELRPRGASVPLTFGSFNHLPKVTPGVVALWSRVLEAVPGSQLLLKALALGDASVQARYRELFRAHGIEDERVELVGWTATRAGHFALYERVDIALDPFPYAGTATTLEALWMGVPVVTLAGRTHVARVGVSVLHAVRLPDLVASDAEAYVTIARDLARDPARLAELRCGLRERIEASPLRAEQGHARDIEAAYRELWRRHCQAPDQRG